MFWRNKEKAKNLEELLEQFSIDAIHLVETENDIQS
jgi:hypothetical protein